MSSEKFIEIPDSFREHAAIGIVLAMKKNGCLNEDQTQYLLEEMRKLYRGNKEHRS